MKNKAEDGWWDLIKLVNRVKGEERLEELFQLLFTHEERHDLAKRLLIIQALIKAEQPQRELAQQLNVSIAKITRGSNALKEIDSKLQEILKKS